MTDIKHMILIASPDMHRPSHADLATVASLRTRIDPDILSQVSVQLAPKHPGPLAAAKIVLGDDRPMALVRYPNVEKFDAAYIRWFLSKIPKESETAVLAVVPADRLQSIAADLTRKDKRTRVSNVLDCLQGPVDPGTGVVVCHKGPWTGLAPNTAQVVQISMPATDCIRIAPVPPRIRRRAVPGSALLGSLFAAGSRQRRQPGL